VDNAVDSISEKFGSDIIKKASLNNLTRNNAGENPHDE
jgi:hypothetical protein